MRAARQVGFFASLPPLGIVALISFNVIAPTLGLAVGLAAGLLIVDVLGWRAVVETFNRERLVAGARLMHPMLANNGNCPNGHGVKGGGRCRQP